jgi:hypothetical protein
MDDEYVPMKHDVATAGNVLNTTSANEGVPKIERQIRVIKERVRATRHTLPFKVIPPHAHRSHPFLKTLD